MLCLKRLYAIRMRPIECANRKRTEVNKLKANLRCECFIKFRIQLFRRVIRILLDFVMPSAQ